MDQRHSSPSPSPGCSNQRPHTHRKRSNSLPLVEALGCSTPEAELILAEGRAAVFRRHGSRLRRERDNRPDRFRPQDHLKYLNREPAASEEIEEPTPTDTGTFRHVRIPSNITDGSTSTVTGPTAPAEMGKTPKSPTSPLWDYSAGLAKFIQTQLNSIASHCPSVYPRSCPDLTPQAKTPTPPQSPACKESRHVDLPGKLEMPPVRPPLRSAFSEWSSTDDDTEEEGSPLSTLDKPKKGPRTSDFTPSLLRYYENSSEATFLFTSTPLEEMEQHQSEDNATPPLSGSHSTTTYGEVDYPSSTLSTHPRLTSSSAPSFSSTSTASYFDCKRPITLAPHAGRRVLISPHPSNGNILTATSPFEGGPLANVHDILVESRNRVLVDGLSFDLMQSCSMASDNMGAMPRLPTPY